MSNTTRKFPFALCLLGAIPVAMLGGCGLYTPEKFPFNSDKLDQGVFENIIVNNIKCELHKGVQDVLDYYKNSPAQLARIEWIRKWGAMVQLKITADELGGISPGVSFIEPFVNSQSATLGLGASESTHGTRIETISFAVSFKELLSERRIERCDNENGVMIQSDLKIGQFIFDKAFISTVGGSAEPYISKGPPYTVISDEITFVAAFGGNITPTWKFTRFTANTSGTLASATRTKTDDAIITLGYVTYEATPTTPVILSTDAQTIHNALVVGSAVGSSNNAMRSGQ
jgi:hypothetical protein